MVRNTMLYLFGSERIRAVTYTDWSNLRATAFAMLVVLAGAFALAAPAAAGCDDDDRPPTPISLKAVPIGSGGITLQWSSNVGHYDIYIFDDRGRPVPEAPNIVGGATNENYHDFYGLQPDKEYFFSMRARTEGGTQGCVSKDASETVSARTDTADLNNICSNYARTAMENVKEMQAKQCQFPSGPIIGRWATSEGTQFEYCIGQRRAHLQGDAKAQWLRNQDLVACKEHADQCRKYRAAAGNAFFPSEPGRCRREQRSFTCQGIGDRRRISPGCFPPQRSR